MRDRVVLIVRRDQEESRSAIELLRSAGMDFVLVDAEDPRVAPTLVEGVGTAVTPTLVTSRGVLPGWDLIKSYLRSTAT